MTDMTKTCLVDFLVNVFLLTLKFDAWNNASVKYHIAHVNNLQSRLWSLQPSIFQFEISASLLCGVVTVLYVVLSKTQINRRWTQVS